MHLHVITKSIGLEGVIVTNWTYHNRTIQIHVELPKRRHTCPACQRKTRRIHDYRIQKLDHLKQAERWTVVFYRKRRYACSCGKRFAESAPFVARYQRQTIEWNQMLTLKVVKAKTFTDTAESAGTSPTTVMRRFDTLAAPQWKAVTELPPVIAIDEYKGDTRAGKFQLIIADPVTRQPLDILPDRRADTLKAYLREKGQRVTTVVMDMSHSFKHAVNQALGRPVIIADRFHYCRYVYWALERVRRQVQQSFDDYDRKTCKRMRHVFYKREAKLTAKQRWHLERFLAKSDDLRQAHALKESFCVWLDQAKERGDQDLATTKTSLHAFYRKVKKSGLDAFLSAIQTLQNWQPEIMNSFAYGYTNGFVEGLNNQTKVLKRNAFGFQRFDRFRMRILLHHQYKHLKTGIG